MSSIKMTPSATNVNKVSRIPPTFVILHIVYRRSGEQSSELSEEAELHWLSRRKKNLPLLPNQPGADYFSKKSPFSARAR